VENLDVRKRGKKGRELSNLQKKGVETGGTKKERNRRGERVGPKRRGKEEERGTTFSPFLKRGCSGEIMITQRKHGVVLISILTGRGEREEKVSFYLWDKKRARFFRGSTEGGKIPKLNIIPEKRREPALICEGRNDPVIGRTRKKDAIALKGKKKEIRS